MTPGPRPEGSKGTGSGYIWVGLVEETASAKDLSPRYLLGLSGSKLKFHSICSTVNITNILMEKATILSNQIMKQK